MDLTTPVVTVVDPVDANTSDLPVVPTDADWDDDSPLPPRRPKLFGKATWTLAGILVAAGCFTLGARIGHDSTPVAAAAAPGRGAATGARATGSAFGRAATGTGAAANRRWRHLRNGAARRRRQHLYPRQPGQRHQDHTGADRDDHGQQAWHPRRLQARRLGGRPRRRRHRWKHRRGDVDRLRVQPGDSVEAAQRQPQPLPRQVAEGDRTPSAATMDWD